MEITAIYLDERDDELSTIDKISWSRAAHVLLVIPNRPGRMARPGALARVRKHCLTTGVQLAITCRNRDITAKARRLGISVFRSEKAARRARWHHLIPRVTATAAGRPERWKALLAKRGAARSVRSASTGTLVFSLCLLPLFLLALLNIPSATIRLAVSEEAQQAALDLPLRIANKEGRDAAGLAAEEFTVVIESEAQVPAGGKVRAATGYAEGRLAITNHSGAELVLPAGSVLVSTDGVQVETTAEIRLPADPETETTVPVRALQAGPQGNAPAGSEWQLEGSTGALVRAVNSAQLTGGSQVAARGMRQNDYDRLEVQLLETMRQQAVEQLAAQAGSQAILLEETVSIVRTLERKQNPPPGYPGDPGRLAQKVEFSGMAVPLDALWTAADEALEDQTTEHMTVVPGFYRVESGSLVEDAAGQLRWQGVILRIVRPDWSAEPVRGLAAGVAPGQAREGRERRLGVPVTISVSPEWWPRLPLLPFRITVEAP